MSSELTNPPSLLFALKNRLATIEGEGGTVAPAQDIAREAIAAEEARQAVAQQAPSDFCDGHCTWLDHHPECERADQAVPAGASQ